MPMMAIYRSMDVGREDYPKIMRGTASDLPDGVVAHFAGFSREGVFCVVDVWESRAQYEPFIPKLKGVLEEVGIPYVEPELYDLEGVIAVDTVQRYALEMAPV